METKRQRKSKIFGEWLDTVINPVPIPVNFEKLKGTGIQFFDFKYKEGIQMLHLHVTPSLIKKMSLSDQSKYLTDLSGRTAFSYRTVENAIESPVLSSEFVKLMTDNNHYIIYNTFRFINDWAVSKTKWKII